MEKINQVAVNGQNYEIEDKVARDQFSTIKNLTDRVAALEKNSIKIISFNERNNETLNSLTVNGVEYTNKEDIVEQLKQLKTCFKYNEDRNPYNHYNVCLINQDGRDLNKMQIVEINNPTDTMIYIYFITINTDTLLVTVKDKDIAFAH